jgi:drug/metabolite transporter (DMT)-like permease
MLFWAGSVVSGRAAAALIPPALFTALRWGGALVLILPFAARHLRRDWPALRGRWWLVLLLGLLGVVTYNSLVYRGLHDTTAVNALLLQSALPLLILVVAFVLFGQRPGRVEVLAILVSVAGVVVIAAEGSLETLRHLRFNPGDVLVFGAVASFAVYSAVLRLKPVTHPLSLLAASIAAGVVILIPLAIAEYSSGARLVVTPLSVGSLVYAAVFPAFLSYVFFNRGVELVGAARAGQFMHLMPAFGIVLAVVFLGERLHPYHGVGMLLIGAGLWMVDRERV